MTSSVTGEKFIEIVRRSGLVSEASFADYAGQPSLAENAHSMAAALVRAGLLTQFQARLLLAGKYRGLVLGNYKLLDQIGRGGMGTVYLAEHTSLKRKAAVKVLSNDQATTAIGTERFYREAQSAAALDHPNIVKVYDVGQFGNVHYIAMEYIEGQTLAQIIDKNGPLHFATAADYIAQAAAGLQEAGDKGFVHRDIKPENLIVDRSGTLKILDMGLTRVADDSGNERLTAVIDPDSVVGTPDYIAPEQALNMPVDIRTDIYSLGVTFYALLTGKPPFSGTTAQKLLQHQLKDAPSLTALRAKSPPEIEPIIATMMEKKPEDRYQQPAEIIEALSPWLSQSAISAGQTRTVGGMLTRITSRINMARAAAEAEAAAELAATERPRRWLVPAVAGILGLALVTCVAAAIAVMGSGTKPTKPADTLATGNSSSTPPTAPQGPPLPNVSELPPLPAGALLVAAEGPAPRFATIAEALATLKPGEKKLVVVRHPVLAEQLTLTGPKHANVTIESGFPNNQVTWTAPANAPDKPLLELASVESVTVRGFKFDGNMRVSDAVRVSGRCPGLVIEDVQLVGFSRAGVSLSGAVGFEDRPVTLRKLRAVSNGTGGDGVLFDTGEASNFVKVLDCRFEGALGAGVAVSGPALNVEVRRNRFYRTRAGIHYRAAAVPFAAQIRSNTFFEVATGIEFASIPGESPVPTGQTAPLSVLDNLFISVRHLAMLAGTPLAPDDAPEWFWTAEKDTNIPAQPRYFRRQFTLAAKPAGAATLNVGVDESFKVWLNGTEVGKSSHDYFSQHVYAFDVTAVLAEGVNVIALEGDNKPDPFSPGFATAAAFMVKLTEAGNPKPLVVSDDQWKSSKVKADGWQNPGFDDASWAAPKPRNEATFRFPWRETTWDSSVQAHWKGEERRLRLVAEGNVRDYDSLEGYPLLESKRTIMVDKNRKSYVGLEPQDDAGFLRYEPGHRLATGGATQGPVGAPPAGQ